MHATSSELRTMLAHAPKEVLAKAVTPNYSGERFYCLECQESRWVEMLGRERRAPERRLGRPLAESWVEASTSQPRAWFTDPMRWRCSHCRARGVRADVERHIASDDECVRRFFIILEGLAHAA